MERRLLLGLLILAILVLAVGGWTVAGLRWSLTAGRLPRLRPRTA